MLISEVKEVVVEGNAVVRNRVRRTDDVILQKQLLKQMLRMYI